MRHDFYEVDYLPENDRIRYTIHPDARKEILKRLLLLNHKIYEEEVQQGLHDKKKGKKKSSAKVDAKVELSHSDMQADAKVELSQSESKVKESQAEYGQQQDFFE